MIVVACIACSLELLRYCVTKEKGPDFVLVRIRLVFVERQQNESVLREVLVAEERSQETLSPSSGDSDVSVVAVVSHIGRDPYPLGQLVGSQVLVELGEVFDVGQTVGVVLDRIVDDQRAALC